MSSHRCAPDSLAIDIIARYKFCIVLYCNVPTYGALSVTALIGLMTLTFDLLTSKYVHGLPVWRASILPILGFLGFFVLELDRGTRHTDEQTDTAHHCIIPPPKGGREHNNAIAVLRKLTGQVLSSFIDAHIFIICTYCIWDPPYPPLGLIWTVMLVWRKGNINWTVSVL